MRIALVFCVAFFLALTSAARAAESAYSEVFYSSGSLRIQAYLYQPAGTGPFPAVVYNHGSRAGEERRSIPFQYVGTMLAQAGYAVLVTERRGYGRSDGPVSSEEIGNDNGQKVVARLQAETDDVLAAVEYLRTLPAIDTKRLAVLGWSFGGIVTMFAVSRSNAFAVAVNQAGGALSWNGNAQLRRELAAAAEKTNIPILLMVAQNDRTTASITTLDDILKKRGVAHRTIIYDPYVPRPPVSNIAPGHVLFGAQGVRVWEKDVLEFLGRYLGPEKPR